MNTEAEIKQGDHVKVVNHDYHFEGSVQSVWRKRNGNLRVVIEDDRGVCLIQSPKNLVHVF